MDVATIGTSLTALNSLISITKSLIGLSKDAAINTKAAEMLSAITDVQAKLLEAQQNMFLMQEELRAAKEELAKKADFSRYELVEPYPGTRLFRLKECERNGSEPIHYICPNCKDVLGKLSVLQEIDYYAICKNKECGQTYDLGEVTPPPMPTFSGY